MAPRRFFKKTARCGIYQKESSEVYLRNDIYCGARACTVCDPAAARLSSSASTIIIVDTNVALDQIDLLENPAIEEVVVLSLVLKEVKHKNLAVYNRLMALCNDYTRKYYVFANEEFKATYVRQMIGETTNDRNDIAIRAAALWYKKHLDGRARILLITNDRENKRKAIEQGLTAVTVKSYVRSLGKPGLLDLVVLPSSEDTRIEDDEDLKPLERRFIYREHKRLSVITSGLLRGIYHQGKLRVNRYNPFEAYFGSESVGDEIIIRGRTNMNRAFDGDIVAVELLPEDQLYEEDDEDDRVHFTPSSADDAPRITNSVQVAPGSTVQASSRQLGRVVGIIRRNYHSYYGCLEPMVMSTANDGVAHALFVSKDRRIPKIRIQTTQLGDLLGKNIIVGVNSWDCLSRYPSGHYVRTIGEIGDRDTETEVGCRFLSKL